LKALIPPIPALESFLDSLTLEAPESAHASRFVVQFDPTHDEQGMIGEGLVLSVYFACNSEMQLESVVKKVSGVLRQLDHPANERLVYVLIAIVACVRQFRKRSGLELLNEVLSHIVQGDLEQHFAFLIPGRLTYRFSAGDFHVGPLDRAKLAYSCSKAGSDYAERYRERLKDLPLSIRRRSKVKVLGITRYEETLRMDRQTSKHGVILSTLAYEYYHLVSDVYFERFFEDFRKAQMIGQAFGSGWLNVDALLRIVQAQRISVYSRIDGQNLGWVSPSTTGFKIDLGGGHIGIPYVERTLQEQFGEKGASPIEPSIQTHCRFLAEAARFEAEGRLADALLYHVIALDLLLGEKGASTSSVTKRSAALTFTILGRSYHDVRDECDKIYDARSKYVHAGRDPAPDLLPKVKQISREVGLLLYRLRQARSLENDFHSEWLKHVNVLVAKAEASLEITDEELRSVGAGLSGEFAYRDLEIGLRKG
jgi:hypothetical protein